MTKKNGIFRVKVDFEDTPITDEKVNGLEGFDRLVEGVRMKFGGKLDARR